MLVGLRQSLGVAWLALVVAEQVNANGRPRLHDQPGQPVPCGTTSSSWPLLVYCVLGLLTDALVRLLERRALSWRRSFVEA